MSDYQRTISNPVHFSGIGLHTGLKSRVTFRPAPVNHGIRFVRTDMENSPEVIPHIKNVVDLQRGTSIEQKGVRIHTVEHVLSALAGLQIDNVYVELTNKEPPVGDGSAKPFVDVLLKAGIVEQSALREYLYIDEPITVVQPNRDAEIVVLPSDEFRVTFLVDYENSAIGKKYTSMYSLEKEYVKEFAPARTFCFLHEVEELHKAGLIRGGNLNNAIVIVDRKLHKKDIESLKKLLSIKGKVSVPSSGILNGKRLRFENEPVRHKTLDLIGDLALLGVPIKAHVLAARSGHEANIELVKKLFKYQEKKKLAAKFQSSSKSGEIIDIRAIEKILPHRYPFLLIDRIIDITPGKKVVAIKSVTRNEPFFNGHFPDRPIFPGVLIVEAMAQAGGFLLLNYDENPSGKLVYFTGIDNAKFRKPVIPGDQMRLEVEVIKMYKSTTKMKGKAYVEGKVVASAEMTAIIVDAEK
ncbi:MAG: bifunctional UDP-3-O-[3-hydroxymyristoyl] N-acetylglucosamine deacetylase/3-hydroxyacyl-ACP dehydratase [Candidatus Marinimicrobia bacterium]|nr:bifunctional UDP-3-O-[3-hydroxymyristoyl] N-acetylglucosamine deacetylase/3-hydroxyacyl-ACP dehydratase [Candidatus Neomarinimicrobiota bacterium]